MTLRVFEAFAGYGSQHMALELLSQQYPDFSYEVVGIAEIDRYAIQAYTAAHGTQVHNYGDISKINWANEVPDFDLFTYSFPCQDISTAGKQHGLTQGSGTRSSLLWECEKAIRSKHPKFLLMENVKALTQQKHRPNFLRWQALLENMGYTNYSQVLNAKHYGVPQNRERCFMVSILNASTPFSFPQTLPLERRLKDMLEDKVDEKYYLSAKQVKRIIDHCARKQAEGCGFNTNFQTPNGISGAVKTKEGSREGDTYVVEPINTSSEIHTHRSEDRATATLNNNEPMLLHYPHGFRKGGLQPADVAPALTASKWQENNFLTLPNPAGYTRLVRARKLTPTECLRLMAVPQRYIDRMVTAGISNCQLYKLAGNSIVVDVLVKLFYAMFIAYGSTPPTDTKGQYLLF